MAPRRLCCIATSACFVYFKRVTIPTWRYSVKVANLYQDASVYITISGFHAILSVLYVPNEELAVNDCWPGIIVDVWPSKSAPKPQSARTMSVSVSRPPHGQSQSASCAVLCQYFNPFLDTQPSTNISFLARTHIRTSNFFGMVAQFRYCRWWASSRARRPELNGSLDDAR